MLLSIEAGGSLYCYLYYFCLKFSITKNVKINADRITAQYVCVHIYVCIYTHTHIYTYMKGPPGLPLMVEMALYFKRRC